MKFIQSLFIVLTVALPLSLFAADGEIKAGDKLQNLVNLHPDMTNRRLYAVNYQLEGLIPMCSTIIVKDISKKKMIFEYKKMEYTYLWDRSTKNAGVSLQENLKHYFGKVCDWRRVKKLSKKDQAGIKTGKPQKGMSKEGILFAMGRPPIHANPDLDIVSWMYWRNKLTRRAIDFDDKGIVIGIR